MHNKFYQKAKKRGKRVVPIIMAATMLLQTGMSNVVLASDVTGEQIQTEGEANPTGETIIEEISGDGVADTTTENQVRDAVDWTQNTESFKLSADKVVYQEKDQKQVTAKNIEDKIDMSQVIGDTVESQRLFVRFAFDQEKTTGQLLPGDYFSFTVPKEYMILTDTTEPVAAFVCNQQAYEAETSEMKDTEILGTYTIKENTVMFTVTELPASGNLFGVLDLAFQWNQQNITSEGTTCELNFQTGTQVQMRLPKKAEEVKEDQGNQSDTESKADTENKTDTENNANTENNADPESQPDADQSDTTKSETQTGESDQTDTLEKDDTDIVNESDAAKEKSEDRSEEDAKTAIGESGQNTANENIIKRLYRSVRSFFSGEETNQNYAGGTSSSHLFGKEELPDGFSQVKISAYNKKDGYKEGDDLRVRFRFDLTLDEDYLYLTLENDIMTRADYPIQGNMTDNDYESAIGKYLNKLAEDGELAPLEYSYDLGNDFRGYNNDRPITLLDSARMACGEYVIIDGVVTFNFYGLCYFYDDIVASVSMEAELDETAVSNDPIDVVFGDQGELVHQSTGTGGGGAGEPEDNNYYIEKSAPVRVSNSEITYTVTAGAFGEQTLNGLQIVDILPDGLEVKSVTYGGKELAGGTDYTYDADSRTLTYSFKADIQTAELTIVTKLSDSKYEGVIQAGRIDESFTNTAELKKAGEDKPLDKSEEVTTNMKFDFLSKVGQEEQLNGARYSWTITANTQLPYLEYGYLVDTLCWTDHRYDFKSGITIHVNDKDIPYENVPQIEGGIKWEDLTAKTLYEFIKGKDITGPFYYVYDTEIANPFYEIIDGEPQFKQMAVLVLPFDLESGWTGTTTQKPLRVKYFTDLNLHGLSKDEYLVEVNKDANRSPDIINEATLLWQNKGGKGPGPRLPDVIDWDKKVDSNVKALSKKGVSYKPSTQELTWKLDVNRYGASLENVIVEDVLEDDYDLKLDSNLTINMRKYNQTNMTQEGGVIVLTRANNAENMPENTYTIIEKEGKKVVKIALGDLVSREEDVVTHYCCTLDFTLKINNPKYLIEQKDDQSATNQATISATLNEEPFKDTAEATFKIPNRLIDKTAVGSYDYRNHKLIWQIEINPNKLKITNAKITDTLPEDITWVGLTDIKKNGVSIESSEWDTLIEVSGNGTKEAAIAFKETIEDTYTFTFESEVTQAWRDANKDRLTNPEQGYAEVLNTAELTGEIYGESIKNASDTATHVIDHMKVGKSGVYNPEEGTIAWTVLLNVDQVNLKGMYLVEDISAANAVHELDVDSVKVEKVKIEENGNVSEAIGQVTNPDLRAIDSNAVTGTLPDARGFAFYLPNGDDYNTYRITFKTELLKGAKNAAIENKVYLKHSDDDNYDESDTSDGGYDGSFDAEDFVTKSTRPKITMTKGSSNSVNLSAEATGLLLGDAKFSLIAYEFTVDQGSKKITLGNEVARYDKVRLTDEAGKALFLNIKTSSSDRKQLLYKLEETTPPAGYNKVEDHYIIFAADDTEYKDIDKVGEVDLRLDENYIVKNATSNDPAETTATLTLQDTPISTEFTFGKEIATGVSYGVDDTIIYTYGGTPTEGAVVFKVEPTGNLEGHVKTRYIANDADGKFKISGLDAGTYKLTEVKSPDNMTIGAKYELKVSWNGNKYDYEINGAYNHNTILDTTGAVPIIKNGYLLGNFSFTKQVKYEDPAIGGTNPNGNVENLEGVAFRLKSTKIAGNDNVTFEKIVKSAADGKVSFTDIPVGEYTLEEGSLDENDTFTATAPGYVKTETIKVKVEEVEDKASVLGTHENQTYYGKKIQVTYTKTDDTNQSVINDENIYSNTAIKGTISFTKVANAGDTGLVAFNGNDSVISGAGFGLFRKIGNDVAEKPTYTAESDGDGKVTFIDVEYGDYVLKETQTPPGYLTMADIELSHKDYTVEFNNSSFTYNVTSTAIEAENGFVKNALRSYSVKLNKRDEDGNGLSGKEFQVYRRNDGKITDIYGSGLDVYAYTTEYHAYTPKPSLMSEEENGDIALSNLPYGDYLLIEQVNDESHLQEGYSSPAVHVSFGIDGAGKDQITVRYTQNFFKDFQSEHYELPQEEVLDWEGIEKSNGVYPIVNNLKYAYIQINKTVANVIGSTLTSTGQKLAGATFEIYQGENTEGTLYLTLTTNKEGQFTVNEDGSYTDETTDAGQKHKHMFYGTYTIKEKSAPEGFKANTDITTFEINENGCGHGGTVWVKTNGDGTLATTNAKASESANDSKKGFFGNELNRGAFSLIKRDTEGNDLTGAKFQILDGTSVVAELKEAAGIYKLAEVPDGTENKATIREVGGVEVPYLFDVDATDGEDYRLLAGTYTVKEVKAPAGYETSNFTFTINEDGTLAVGRLTDGYGTVKRDNSTAILADKPISLEIDKRALTLDGTGLQGAEFSVTGYFTNPEAANDTISLTEANRKHRFKPNEAYELTETKAPYGYLKGGNVIIEFNEKGEIKLPKSVTNHAVDSTIKDKLIYVDKAFEISLNKVDATDASVKLAGAEFSLTGYFADETTGDLESTPDTITVTSTADGIKLSEAIQSQSSSCRLAQGQTYTLTETKASDGYILPDEPMTVEFAVDENGKVQFTETSDITGNNTDTIAVKNHRIAIKLQKRDATDGAILTTATVTLKDITNPNGVKKVSAQIHDGTVTYENSIADPFLIQGHTYEVWEDEKGTPTGYETPSEALATFTVNANGTLSLTESKTDSQGNPLVAVTVDENKVSTVTVKNERKTGEIAIHKVDAGNSTINLKGAVFNLYKDESNEPLSVNGSTDIVTGDDGKVTVSGLEWGTYVLKEMIPPTGYEISKAMSDGIGFAIGAESLTPQITSAGAKTGGTIENSKTVFTLTKVDENGDSLSGATFSLKDMTQADYNAELKDSASHTLEGVLIAGHTYKLEETVPPAGYMRETATVRFKMLDDGTIEKVENENSSWSGSGYTITEDKKGIQLKDKPIVFALKKTAESGTGAAQEGVSFKMTPADASQFVSGGTELTGTTDANGIWKVEKELVPGKTYNVTETKALAGYTYASDFVVSVDADGKVSVDSKEITADKPYSVVDQPLNISIYKKDDTTGKNPIEGIAFTLTKNGDTTRTWNLKSDAKGKLNVVDGDNLLSDKLAQILEVDDKGSTYTLTEVVQPNSPYVQLKAPVQFTMDRSGKMTEAKSTDVNVDLSSQLLISENKQTLDITNIRTSLSIEKKDANGLLAGAELGIYSAVGENQSEIGDIVTLNGSELKWTSSAEEAYSLRGLPTGIYWLKETGAPTTYVTADPIQFEITNDGTVNILNSKGSVTGTTITMTDELVVGQFTLTKKQTGTDSKVAGAVFDLYKQDSDKPADTDTKLAEGIITGADGTWTSESSEIPRLDDDAKTLKDGLLYGNYYLKETSTPDEYQLDSTAIPFTIEGKADGDQVVQPDAKAVTAENVLYSRELAVEKQDKEDQTLLSDATFSLTRIKDAAGVEVTEESVETTTDSEGKATFTIAKKGTYKLSEITAPKGYVDATRENPTYEKEFVVGDDTEESIILETGDTKNVIVNERKTGTLTLMKQDGADKAALDGVTFTLYKKNQGNIFQNIYNFFTGNTYDKVNETEWSEQVDETGKLTISGLTWGEYYVEETSPLPGYVPDDTKYEFTIGRYQSDIVLSVDKGIIENTQTELRFNKTGLFNESCADVTLGTVTPDAVQVLEGITFTAYTDVNATEQSKVAEAVSDANGEVVFKKLAIGTYYIKETALSERAIAEHYKLNEGIYKAVIDQNGQFAGLQTVDGAAIQNNTIVNDVNRTDIVIEKVDEKNPDRKLPGSTYGLFRRASTMKSGEVSALALSSEAVSAYAEEEWVQVAQATTDENGILRFSGVLMETEYQIRELIAPDGCYVSEKPLTITFTMEDGKTVIKSFDDGSGTTMVDPETGEIIWKEPQVEVEFAKKDEEGKLLAGAKLEVQDKDGNVIESWTSSAEEAYTSYGKLIIGNTYKLVETEAPEGYEIAEPIEFTIPGESVGPNEDKVIHIEMIDKKTPENPKDPTKPADKAEPKETAKKLTPATKVVNAVKTGDFSSIWGYIALLVIAAVAIVAGITYKKKRR